MASMLPAANVSSVPGLQGMCIILDRLMACAGSVVRPQHMTFAGPVVRPNGLLQPLKLLHDHVRCNPACFMTAMVLLDRVGIPPGCNVLQHLLMACLVISIKTLDDDHYTNKGYAQLFGVSTEQLNKIEAEFLTLINWETFVDEATYTTMLATCLEEERGRGIPEATPPPMVYNQTSFTLRRHSASESIGILYKDARVVGVVCGGVSARAGLQRNMTISAINGVPVAHHHEVAAAITNAPATFTVDIEPTPAPAVGAAPGLQMATPPQETATPPTPASPMTPLAFGVGIPPAYVTAPMPAPAAPVMYVISPPGWGSLCQQPAVLAGAVPCAVVPQYSMPQAMPAPMHLMPAQAAVQQW